MPVTADVRYAIRDSKVKSGLVTVTVPGSGASVMIFEPVAEVMDELKVAFELFAGEGGEGIDKLKNKVAVAPRVQSSIMGRSVTVPLVDGALALDPYEEIFLIDLDKKEKRREISVFIMGEGSEEEAPQHAQQRRK